MAQLQPSADSTLSQSLHDHWRVFLAEGILLIVLGIAAVVVPFIAGLAATVFVGWVFLLAGILGLVATFRARGAPGFGWAIASAIAAIVAGGILLWNPLQGLVTLTFVMTAFFVVDGIFIIVLAITHRRELTGRWEWMLINGLIDLILAAIILTGLPGTILWAIGLLLGIDLIFGGVSLIGMALAARPSAAHVM
ncbi:MAG TPA: HdeD family acid-resistance protein [Methylovirgula sp.]